jgi:hypothetical protein
MNLRPNGMSGALTPRSQAIENPTDKQWLTILVGFGVLLLVAEVFTFRAHRDNLFYWVLFWLLISGIPFVFAVWWTFQCKKFPANTLLIILFGGLLFRSILVPLDPPRLSTDIYRYIWDGRVQAAGINPYPYLPVDARLAELRDGSSQTPRWCFQSFRHFPGNDSRGIPYRCDFLSRGLHQEQDSFGITL